MKTECLVTSEPESTSLPESLSILKTSLRVEHDADDDYLKQLLREAAAQVTERTGRQILTCERRLLVADWWGGTIDVPFPPTGSITNIKYLDTSETEQTLSSVKYSLDTSGKFARVRLKDSLPELSDEVELPIQINYECGYGVDESTVPAGLRTPIRELVRTWYETKDPTKFPPYVDALLDRWKLKRFK